MVLRKLYPPLLLIALAVPAAFLWWAEHYSPGPRQSRSCPQTMSEVVAIAKNLNLHYQGDRLDGTVQTRLLISESHLTWERLCKLSVVYGPDHPDWMGTVAVYRNAIPPCEWYPDGYEMVPWGQFHLFGDRSLIQRLTEQPGSD